MSIMKKSCANQAGIQKTPKDKQRNRKPIDVIERSHEVKGIEAPRNRAF